MWWRPFDELCVISERPVFLRLDHQERLHCDDGAAIGFRDGWEVWAWRGMAVPREGIEAPVFPEGIDAEPNAETYGMRGADYRRIARA